MSASGPSGPLVFFTVFLKNRNISSKIKRSKVTDYAALRELHHYHAYLIVKFHGKAFLEP